MNIVIKKSPITLFYLVLPFIVAFIMVLKIPFYINGLLLFAFFYWVNTGFGTMECSEEEVLIVFGKIFRKTVKLNCTSISKIHVQYFLAKGIGGIKISIFAEKEYTFIKEGSLDNLKAEVQGLQTFVENNYKNVKLVIVPYGVM